MHSSEMLHLLWSATGLLYSLFPFSTYHTELKSTMAVTAVWAEEMWVSLSLPGTTGTHRTFLACPSCGHPAKFPNHRGPAGELGNEIPQSWGLSSSTNDVSCSQPAEVASPPALPQLDFPLITSTLLELSFFPSTFVVFCDYLCCLPRDRKSVV